MDPRLKPILRATSALFQFLAGDVFALNQYAGFTVCRCPDRGKNVFTEMDVSWETIVAVEETTPDLWGEKWQEHLLVEATADTKGN